jgi:hypothetical protein
MTKWRMRIACAILSSHKCNTYCFSTAIMVTRTCPNVTFIRTTPLCFFYIWNCVSAHMHCAVSARWQWGWQVSTAQCAFCMELVSCHSQVSRIWRWLLDFLKMLTRYRPNDTLKVYINTRSTGKYLVTITGSDWRTQFLNRSPRHHAAKPVYASQSSLTNEVHKRIWRTKPTLRNFQGLSDENRKNHTNCRYR